MSIKAVIALNKDSMINGTVENLIEITNFEALSFKLPANRVLWDCGTYPVAIGDEWNDGIFTRNGEHLTPIPTAEQEIAILKEENASLNEQITNLELALCDLYEASL